MNPPLDLDFDPETEFDDVPSSVLSNDNNETHMDEIPESSNQSQHDSESIPVKQRPTKANSLRGGSGAQRVAHRARWSRAWMQRT